jgi:hypothetical protein
MEEGSNFNHYETQSIVTNRGANLFYTAAFGSILMIVSRVPTLVYYYELMNNVIPSPVVTIALFLSIGTLIALVAGILLGLGLMALMKRYGKTYGPILFLAVIAPYLFSQFTAFQYSTPEELIGFRMYSFAVSIVTSIIIGIGILSVRIHSVNPALTGITGILTIVNPIISSFSGLLLMIIEDPTTGYLMYFLTGFAFPFVVSIFLFMLFYGEARSGVALTLDW